MNDERILHLWDAHVGAPNPRYPLTEKDALAFARAVLAASGKDEQIRKLREALTEMYESDAAPYPDESQGAAAQDAWAERRNTARQLARAALKETE